MTQNDLPRLGQQAQSSQERNPTWMGQVQDQHYQAAPDHPAGGSNHGAYPDLPPAPRSAFPPAAGRRSAGMVILVAGGGALAFAGLFLVLPYLLANTGVAGFTVGFVASLIPLTAVLLAVFVIDPWEPEPKRLLLFAFTWGAVVSVAATLVIQPIFALAGAPPPGVDYSTFALTVQVILHSTWNSMATGRGRRQAIRWAKSFGHGAQMKSFVGFTTELAFVRQRILSGRNVAEH